MNNSGLSDSVIATIHDIFKQYPNVEKAVLYGSRAKGNYKNGSDIDLSLMGEDLSYDDLLSISGDLDDSFIPHKVDLSIFDKIDNTKLREHIDRVGVVFYERAEKKAGWEIKRLGDIAIIKGGKRLPKGYKLQAEKTHHPYITVSDFNDNGSVDIENIRYISDEVFRQISRYTISVNDMYISIAGTIGKTGIIPTELEAANLTENACKLVFNQGIDKEFVHYFTKTTDFIIQAGLNTRTAAQPKLALERLQTIKLPIPSLPEQKRIVAILDEVFAGIAKAKQNAEKNLQNAREIFETTLHSIFANAGEGWEEKRLKDICEKITDGTHQTPQYYEEGITFLSSRNVTSGKINWDNIKYIDIKQHIEMHKRVAPRINDILLAKNGTTGVAAIVDKEVVFDIYVSLALLRARDMILPRLLLYFINSPVAKKQFNKRLKGSGVPNLHLEEIREVVISFPKYLPEQQAIVAKLDSLAAQTKQLEAIYQKKLASLEELKKSVLQKAFAGEL